MSEIDWSKAPEGATHCSKSGVWFKSDVSGIYVFTSGVWKNLSWATWQLDFCECRPATPQWNGEGMPPVGLRCEAAIPHTSGPDNERSFIWIEGSVIAYYEINGKTYAWFAEDDGFYPPNVLEFRPIRTPEQIAADERADAINKMIQFFEQDEFIKDSLGKLYDAGYRKQEPKP